MSEEGLKPSEAVRRAWKEREQSLMADNKRPSRSVTTEKSFSTDMSDPPPAYSETITDQFSAQQYFARDGTTSHQSDSSEPSLFVELLSDNDNIPSHNSEQRNVPHDRPLPPAINRANYRPPIQPPPTADYPRKLNSRLTRLPSFVRRPSGSTNTTSYDYGSNVVPASRGISQQVPAHTYDNHNSSRSLQANIGPIFGDENFSLSGGENGSIPNGESISFTSTPEHLTHNSDRSHTSGRHTRPISKPGTFHSTAGNLSHTATHFSTINLNNKGDIHSDFKAPLQHPSVSNTLASRSSEGDFRNPLTHNKDSRPNSFSFSPSKNIDIRSSTHPVSTLDPATSSTRDPVRGSFAPEMTSQFSNNMPAQAPNADERTKQKAVCLINDSPQLRGQLSDFLGSIISAVEASQPQTMVDQNQTIKEQRTKIQQLQADFSAASNTKVEQARKNADLEARLEAAIEKETAQEKTLAELNAKIHRSEEVENNLRRGQVAIHKELSALRADNPLLKRKFKAAEQEIRRLEKELERQDHALGKYDRQAAEVERNVRHIEDRLAKKEKENYVLYEQGERMKAEMITIAEQWDARGHRDGGARKRPLEEMLDPEMLLDDQERRRRFGRMII